MLERKESAVKFRCWKRVRWKPRRHWGWIVGKREIWGWVEVSVDREVVLRYVPFTGWLLVAIRHPDDPLRVERSFDHWEYKEMKKRTPALSNPESSAEHLASMESDVFSKLHSIVRQCAVTRYEDGDKRQPGSLFISTQGSMWRVTVTEPDSCLKLTMMAATLDDALAGVCLALESESIPWEVDAYAMSKKPKKKN